MEDVELKRRLRCVLASLAAYMRERGLFEDTRRSLAVEQQLHGGKQRLPVIATKIRQRVREASQRLEPFQEEVKRILEGLRRLSEDNMKALPSSSCGGGVLHRGTRPSSRWTEGSPSMDDGSVEKNLASLRQLTALYRDLWITVFA